MWHNARKRYAITAIKEENAVLKGCSTIMVGTWKIKDGWIRWETQIKTNGGVWEENI